VNTVSTPVQLTYTALTIRRLTAGTARPLCTKIFEVVFGGGITERHLVFLLQP